MGQLIVIVLRRHVQFVVLDTILRDTDENRLRQDLVRPNFVKTCPNAPLSGFLFAPIFEGIQKSKIMMSVFGALGLIEGARN